MPLASILALSCSQAPAASAPTSPASPPPLSATPPSMPEQQADEVPRGRSIHYSLLARFAPESLPGFTSGPLAASTSRFGGVAVTEVERTYKGGEQQLELRIVDSNVNGAGKAPAVAEPYEDEQRIGRPLKRPSSVGYVEFEKANGRAHADLIVAGRLVLTLDQDEAEGTAALERFCATLDTAGLAKLLEQQAPGR